MEGYRRRRGETARMFLGVAAGREVELGVGWREGSRQSVVCSGMVQWCNNTNRSHNLLIGIRDSTTSILSSDGK